jgi:hypothetical protein
MQLMFRRFKPLQQSGKDLFMALVIAAELRRERSRSKAHKSNPPRTDSQGGMLKMNCFKRCFQIAVNNLDVRLYKYQSDVQHSMVLIGFLRFLFSAISGLLVSAFLR